MSDQNLIEFKNFFENVPIALIRTDVKTAQIIMANEKAVELFGYSSVEELTNSKTTDFYPVKLREKLIKMAKKTGVVERYEVEMKLPSKTIWVSLNLAISKDNSVIDVALVDISDLMEAKQNSYNMLKDLSEQLDMKLSKVK